MKLTNHIYRLAVTTIIVTSVFIGHTSQSRSIFAGEKVKLFLADKDSTRIEGKLILKGTDSIGILHSSLGSMYYSSSDINKIKTHRKFSGKATGKGMGFGSIAGSVLGFAVISMREEKNYAATILFAMLGSITGSFIGGLVGENLTIEKESMFISYETIEDSPPDYAESIKCGEKVEIIRKGDSVVHIGKLYSYGHDNLEIYNAMGGKENYAADDISKACVHRSNLIKGIEKGFAYGASLGAVIDLIYYYRDSKDEPEGGVKNNYLRTVSLFFGGGLLVAIFGSQFFSNVKMPIEIENLWQMPGCNRNQSKGEGIGLILKINIE